MAVERKRRRDDFDVSEIESIWDNATIHGIVTAISPVKASKSNEQMRYFNAKLSDGNQTIRVISFSPSLHDTFQDFCSKSTPIALTDCQVKEVPAQYQKEGNNFEVVASSHSSLVPIHSMS